MGRGDSSRSLGWHWGRGGMGPRMREDKGGVFTPILTFPPQGGREGKEGGHRGTRPTGKGCGGRWEWRTVMGWRALGGGDEIVRGASEWHLGERRKDGSPHARGQGGSFHPHPNLPPSRGKGGEGGAHEGRPYGGRGVRWAVGMAHSNGMEGC